MLLRNISLRLLSEGNQLWFPLDWMWGFEVQRVKAIRPPHIWPARFKDNLRVIAEPTFWAVFKVECNSCKVGHGQRNSPSVSHSCLKVFELTLVVKWPCGGHLLLNLLASQASFTSINSTPVHRHPRCDFFFGYKWASSRYLVSFTVFFFSGPHLAKPKLECPVLDAYWFTPVTKVNIFLRFCCCKTPTVRPPGNAKTANLNPYHEFKISEKNMRGWCRVACFDSATCGVHCGKLPELRAPLQLALLILQRRWVSLSSSTHLLEWWFV